MAGIEPAARNDSCQSPARAQSLQPCPARAAPNALLSPLDCCAPSSRPSWPWSPRRRAARPAGPAFPRSPHRRVLPPSREPGLWAGDAPQASRVGPQGEPELAKTAPRREALRAPDEAARDDATPRARNPGVEASAEASDEPPECKGQDHHVISRSIARKLDGHQTLKELSSLETSASWPKRKIRNHTAAIRSGTERWTRRSSHGSLSTLRSHLSSS